MYTDASCSQLPDGSPHVKLCYILHNRQNGQSWGQTSEVPSAVIKTFGHKQTYISQGEALAPFIAL
eukprot:7528332-Karenia_brevis.AAC.1